MGKEISQTEILLELPGGTYQLSWEHTYGRAVWNPDRDIEGLVNGTVSITPGRRKLLFGTHLNGRCPADCMGCPFGHKIMGNFYGDAQGAREKTLARPVTPAEFQTSITEAIKIGLESGLIFAAEKLSSGSLLAGDPGYSPHVSVLIATLAANDRFISSRWSTIAPQTQNNVLEAFITGAKAVKEEFPGHTPSFQVSLHSTDHPTRQHHTGVNRLISMTEIADASRELFDLTGRRATLSFVVHRGSVLEPDVLFRHFSPVHNLVSLRPMYSKEYPSIPAASLLGLYRELRKKWDVVFMPPNQEDSVGGTPIELHNLRRSNT